MSDKNYLFYKSTLDNIASAIKNKTSGFENVKPSGMPSAIRSIKSVPPKAMAEINPIKLDEDAVSFALVSNLPEKLLMSSSLKDNVRDITPSGSSTNVYELNKDNHYYYITEGNGYNISSLYNSFNGCTQLTGEPISGNYITNMNSAYYNCPNVYGNLYLGYSGLDFCDATNAFYGRDNSKPLNIYVKKNSKWDYWLHEQGDKLVGSDNIGWRDQIGGYYSLNYKISVFNNL